MSETRITLPANQPVPSPVPPAIRYLKQTEDRSRARAAAYRAAVIPMASVVVFAAVVLQAFSFPVVAAAIVFIPWIACVVLYVLAKAAEKRANDLHAASIEGLANWVNSED